MVSVRPLFLFEMKLSRHHRMWTSRWYIHTTSLSYHHHHRCRHCQLPLLPSVVVVPLMVLQKFLVIILGAIGFGGAAVVERRLQSLLLLPVALTREICAVYFLESIVMGWCFVIRILVVVVVVIVTLYQY